MKQELTTIFQELSALNTSLEYEVKLVSVDNTLKFKQLTTKQFNEILGTLILDSNNTDTGDFNTCMCKILAENLSQGVDSIEQLSFIDYVKVVLETRKQCISDNLNVIFSNEDIEKYNLEESYNSVSLQEHLNKIVEIQIPSIDVNKNGITITVGVPSIKKIIKLDRNVKYNATTSTAETIKNYFIKELGKYIDNIIINGVSVNFENTDIKDYLEVINNVPALLINETIAHIEKIKQSVNTVTNVMITCKQSNGEVISFNKELTMDGNLFNF